MGAQYNAFTFPPVLVSELKALWKEKVESLVEEYGSERYSGYNYEGQNLRIVDKGFTDEKEADDFIVRNTDKYGDVFAVRIGDFTKVFDRTKIGAKLAERKGQLRSEVLAFEENIIKKVQAGKSKTRGCGRCGSSIAVKYLSYDRIANACYLPDAQHAQRILNLYSGVNCPVCGHAFLITETDRKRKARLEDRWKEAEVAYREAKTKFEARQKDKPFWLVGGWCPS